MEWRLEGRMQGRKEGLKEARKKRPMREEAVKKVEPGRLTDSW